MRKIQYHHFGGVKGLARRIASYWLADFLPSMFSIHLSLLLPNGYKIIGFSC